MIPEPLTFVLLLLVGGWIALDGTSFGQFMISRPLVAASLGGWIVGAPVEGATLGVILEALHLMVLPVGASRNPEAGPAALASGAAYALAPPGPAMLLAAVVFALIWEALSGESVRQLRKLNMVLAVPTAEHEFSPAALERRHLAAIGVDFLRGTLIVATGFFILSLLMATTDAYWGLGERLPQLLLTAALAAALAASVHRFETHRRVRFLLIGAVVGLLVLLLR